MNNSGPIVLSELLAPETINLQLSGTQRDQVLSELVGQIKELNNQPQARETLLRALEEREQLHSTGIGDGVALPHARNALVGLVNRPIMVFGRHQTGVPYGAIDGAPAKLFFLLIAPTVTQHLSMLARISRVLRDPKVRRGLLAADSADKVIKTVKDAEARI
ncbi:PTS sugar transporter subunit IIA [Pedosphaera parvula]|uniref:Putative PTS IIA-like nitrogen-regulatory protein PtsN n=1 Tax=Pedosphaera parvula (strain Ellin514) TaxID=320771 RepID=B9XDA3_PEDPL|nr:PTS sugar transporter subunit IIA [Pedosphaera parvula]EEF62049.1 putative PTS IIA-like nitrogen-regulatory protein PtsN [Pedosphaera parvula Ellin514]